MPSEFVLDPLRGRKVARFASTCATALVVVTCSMVAGGSTPAASRINPAQIWQLPEVAPTALLGTMPMRSCASLVSIRPSRGTTIRASRLVHGVGSSSGWCEVTIDYRDSPAATPVTVWLVLPVQGWNGRFLGLGGGGWIAGFPFTLGPAASRGFAAAITNAGRPYELSTSPQTLVQMVGQDDFLLGADGHLKQRALEEFAYLGVHQMTVIGKAVVRDFYGVAPKYSYFSGCSTGGRQGQAEVQRYPADYDGVLSGAPAINWAHFGAAGLWPVAVTRSLGSVAQCKFDAVHRAAVAACDGSDGLRDGLVASIGICHFNPQSLVGTKTSCGVISKRDAEVIKLIWDGPRQGDGTRLWNGIDPAALIHAPEEPATWAAPFFDGRIPDQGRFSYADFEKSYEHLVERYGTVMDTSNPNLLDFADRGGKTIIWQGVADDLIPAEGSVHYFESIRRTLGDEATGRFLRLYLAPGVRHCMGGDGPQPVGLLTPLIDWVEKGRAPTIVRSQNVDDKGRVTRTRPLCPYPLYAHYAGSGSVDDAVNFRCQR